MLDIGPIKKRCEAATKGPWENCSVLGGWDGVKYQGSIIATLGFNEPRNAEFIAESRQDIPELIAEVEQLRVKCKILDTFPVPLRNTTIDSIDVAEFRWGGSTVVYVDHKLTHDVYDHAVEKLEAGVDN